MDLLDVLDQVRELLQRKGRITYRMLKAQFQLDDDTIDTVREELIVGERVAVDEDGKVLVWIGEKRPASSVQRLASHASPSPDPRPVSYTPAHLAERIRAATITDGERKTITALFADLKSSTALIEGLDPEEARAIIDPALQLMMDAVHRYEGYVAQALGDGIFALFGAPIAHEDHPQRALYAALRMQEEMRRYGDQIRLKYGVPLAMRIGINTGEVVVRSIRKDDLHADYVPVGHSTNLAARMEQMATPGSILATAYTHKLTEGYFAFRELGATQIKGVEEPLAVYEVLGAGPLRTRLQVTATRRGLTRFVGRQAEIAQLRNALTEAKEGRGQVVGVMGEAGLGKSRLFYEFKLLSQPGCLLLEAYSVSHGKASSYLPVIELLKSYFRIEAADDERTRREKVAGKVVILDRALEDTLPYLYALLGVEDQPSPLQQMDPQIRRKRTFEALKKLLLRESLNQPVILIFEDLHWIDSETQGVLDTLSEGIASARILLLVNYRPEYRHEWGSKTYYTQLRLTPFGKGEAEEFLTFMLGTATNLAALKRLILEKTEGTPFFMEEVIQTLVEDGTLTGERGHYTPTHSVISFQLPTTVQGVLAARIDRLAPDEKIFLQQLAVIGREFSLGLVRRVMAIPDDPLALHLSALQYKEFLYEQPAFPDVEYLFKHALTQEVAYNSMLIERRKALHEQTAQAIEQLYLDQIEDHYSELAHHYSRSSNTDKAVEYLDKAGRQAVKRSANTEAAALFTTALELLNTHPESLARDRQELALQLALGPALNATKGFHAPEVGSTYARAQQLCQQLNDSSRLFDILMGLRVFHTVRGQYRAALALGEQLVQLAEASEDPAWRMAAHYAIAPPLFFLGQFAAVPDYVATSVRHYDRSQHDLQIASYGQSHAVQVLGYAAFALFFLGYPDQALAQAQAGTRLAHELAHPLSLTQALFGEARTHLNRREPQEARVLAETLAAMADEHGMLMQTMASNALLAAAASAWEGGLQELEQLQQAIQELQSRHIDIWMLAYMAQLAEAYAHVGKIDEGLHVLSEALTGIQNEGDSFYEAEIFRTKGELTLQSKASLGQVEDKFPTSPSPSAVEKEAEAYFLKAIEVSQKQHAKSLELRATVSLVRLRQQQAAQSELRNTQHTIRTRLDEAHQMLSNVYNWFTEGFDTKDLQEARALLHELAEGQ